MGKLDGKVVLITGAGSGIGRATACLFAKEGAKVAVDDYAPNILGGEETVRMIKAAGGEAVLIEADVSRAADVERMVRTTVDTYGRIDILFNNAASEEKGSLPTADKSEEEWDSVIDTALKSVFLGSKYAIPVMLAQGGGVIVNNASVLGLGGYPGKSAYHAAKAGVINLTQSVAREYAGQNIRVNCVCPGAIMSPFGNWIEEYLPALKLEHIPQGRVGRPEEIAQAVLYLASSDSSYVTGASFVVDGGWAAGPAPLT